MQYALICCEGPVKGRRYFFPDKPEQKEIKIGRHPDCHIKIPEDDYISKRHAIIYLEGESPRIVDSDSTHGVWINQKREFSYYLQEGDKIKLGNSIFIFRSGEELDPVSALIESDSPLKESAIYSIDSTFGENMTRYLQRKFTEEESYYLAQLLKISNDIGLESDFNLLLKKIMRIVLDTFNADRGFIMLYDERCQKLKPVLAKTRIIDIPDQKIAFSRTLINKVKKEKKSILVFDAQTEPSLSHSSSIFEHNIRSVMCVPFIREERFLGVMQIDTISSDKVFKEKDLEFFTCIGYQVAVVLENFRLIEKIKEEVQLRTSLSYFLSNKLIDAIISGKIPLRLGGESAEVTIFFLDFRGFTRISEKIPASEVIELLNEYFTELSEIIFEHEGMINQFVGDEIMAIFGGWWSNINGAESAVKSALKILEKIKELNLKRESEKKETIQIGIGINYGEVIIGNIGTEKKMEFTAIGDTTNTAARFCSRAKAGQILITESVYSQVKDRFKIRPLKPIKVKNKELRLKRYEVIG